jgi:hypothetical protein
VSPARTVCALILAVTACSNAATEPSAPASSPADADLLLLNATERPLAFFAIAADLEPFCDPIPELPVTASHIEVVAAGQEQPLGQVPGRAEAPQGGVAVFLYELSADGRQARYTRLQLVSGADLRRSGGRILIR